MIERCWKPFKPVLSKLGVSHTLFEQLHFNSVIHIRLQSGVLKWGGSLLNDLKAPLQQELRQLRRLVAQRNPFGHWIFVGIAGVIRLVQKMVGF